MVKPTITLTVGCSGSGKTTWVEEQKKLHGLTITFTDLNRDELRFDLFTDGERNWTKYKFSKAKEKRVSDIIDREAEHASEEKEDIVISDTNLNIKTREKWKQWAIEHNYGYQEKLFPCKWEELVKRNAQREGGLPEHRLWSQYNSYMQQFGYIGEHKLDLYKENPSLGYTMWVDIDGTVADMKGVRKPFEWDKVSLDKPKYPVIDMVCARAERVRHITFMSGRDSVCYEDTKEWIERYFDLSDYVKWDLHMRESGDSRKDDVVKYELFNKHIRGVYNVDCAFDDRYSIIRLESLLGIPNIIQVGEYLDEF